MNKKQQRQLIWVSLIIGIIVIIAALTYVNSRPGKLDDFAACLKERGAIFYGAYWCPHCQEQKRIFGNSAKVLPYVECSLPGGGSGGGVTLECQKANITSYPTWDFADGTRQAGVLTLSQLAEYSGCELTQQ